MQKIPILYVDDERENLENFEIFFERDYQVFTCQSANDAFDLLQTQDIWIIISDQRMPEMTGIEFFEQIKTQYPEILRIMLTAYTEENYLLEAINRGAVYRYLTKPWNKIELESVLHSAGETARLKQENKALIQKLQEKVLELEHREETLRNIFNSSSDGIVVMKPDQTIITANRALALMLQYPIDEIIGRNVQEFIHESSHELLEERWNKLFVNDLPIVEYPIVRRDSQVFTVEIKSQSISYEGHPALLSLVRDITEKKHFERQLFAARVNAEEHERERIARDLHDGIGPLLSTLKIYMHDISHATKDLPQAAAAEMANEIISEAILSVKEISNNVSPHILRNFGLSNAISNFIERLEHKTTLQFRFESAFTERINEIIETTLYRILIELINNTLKYAEASLVTIAITRKNNLLYISYIDNGKGFDFKAKIESGKGLGLQNMHSRLHAIGAHLSYKTSENEGVIIEIELPIVE